MASRNMCTFNMTFCSCPPSKGTHSIIGLGWTSTYAGTMEKIPIFLRLYLTRVNILPSTKSGSLSANVTFAGLNMTTKRPHSRGWRYQLKVSRIVGVHKVSRSMQMVSTKVRGSNQCWAILKCSVGSPLGSQLNSQNEKTLTLLHVRIRVRTNLRFSH